MLLLLVALLPVITYQQHTASSLVLNVDFSHPTYAADIFYWVHYCRLGVILVAQGEARSYSEQLATFCGPLKCFPPQQAVVAEVVLTLALDGECPLTLRL